MKSTKRVILDPVSRGAMMKEAFATLYQCEPRIAVRAPGRVDLMGSHTDYNEGFVLTLSIDRDTHIIASPTDDQTVKLTSLNLDSRCEFSLTNSMDNKLEGWGRYVQGVAVCLQEVGHELSGFQGVVHSTVPIGSGLSSSASLEAAVATLFERLGGFELTGLQKARLCQKAENEWVGVNCGILDQYSSILGQENNALLLDCRSLSHEYVTIPYDISIVICNTCVPRQLTGSEYGERREQCESGARYFSEKQPGIKSLRDVSVELYEMHKNGLPEVVRRRSQFVVEENARVGEIADALRTNDRPTIQSTMNASYMGAKELFGICIPAMDSMCDAMDSAPGRIGCRQAGAGFGGCMIALVESTLVDEFCESVSGNYRSATGIAAEVFEVFSADGAGLC